MLLQTLLLPETAIQRVLSKLGLIIMIVYPVGFMLLGLLMRHRLKINQMANRILKNEKRLSTYIDNAPDGIFVADSEGSYIDVNPAACRITGYEKDELLSMHLIELLVPEDVDKAENHFKTVVKKGRATGDFHYRRKDGVVNIWTIDAVKLDENTFLGFAKDITDRKKSDEALKSSERLLRTIAKNYPNSYLTLVYRDMSLGFTSGQEFIKHKIDSKQFIGKKVDDIYGDKAAIVKEKYMRAFRGEEVSFELFFNNEHQLYHVVPLRELDGSIQHILSVAENITPRKEAEDAMKKSLQEKEILLKELYHRTKNNMQVISSMLQMQALIHDEDIVKNVVNDTSNRIQSIALVHQKLYQSKDLSSLILKDYFDDLIHLLLSSFFIDENSITVAREMEEFPVLIDIAIPCGLILNELVTNSIKYAFDESIEGTISLKLKRSLDGKITIDYRDNGKGFKDDFDFHRVDTFGFKTIKNICEHQLNGIVNFNGKGGFHCDLTFYEGIYKRRV
jgi:PAS domain S-box-containing protein